MSFEGFDPAFDIGLEETKRRRNKSAIPSFTGDLDLDSLARGVPFPSSADFGKAATQRNLLGQRGRVRSTPLRVEAEGDIGDAFLADPLSAPEVDPSIAIRNGRKNRRDRGRASLVKERSRLGIRGGRLASGKTRGARLPRNRRQAEQANILDLSFRGVLEG